MSDPKILLSEKRLYNRLDHIFPVEFQLLTPDNRVVFDWQQGFSQDISSGGLCLIVNYCLEAGGLLLENKETHLRLRIHLPVGIENITATARIAWVKKNKTDICFRYTLGLEYEHIDPRENLRIMRYVRGRRVLKIMAVIFTLLLSAALVVAGFYNAKLRLDKERLLGSLSANIAYQRLLYKNQDELKSQIDDMKELFESSEKKSKSMEEQLRNTKADDQKTIERLSQSLELLKTYKEEVKNSLNSLEARKEQADEAVKVKKEEGSLLEKQIQDKLYLWLVSHRNNYTGLVSSFEGDENIKDWGFTYDQALSAMNFINAGDIDSAKKIFDFYQEAERVDGGGFVNAYYVSSGEPAEFVAHVGPNAWLGMAIMQYIHKTQDTKYLKLAQSISRWLDIVKDGEGGLRGGKNISWYSTEHNLDAYAFYKMLAIKTKDPHYEKRAGELLSWLSKNAYSNISSPFVKRGKGDSTIATDTYAWSISAIGPKTLKEIGMDPDAIIDFALSNCGVEIAYVKPEGITVNVKGFDFAKSQNLARGGVISCEWTAQMALALKEMADFHRLLNDQEKADHYARLADEYISEMGKMIIVSPSPVGQGDFCLPYASQEFADTGHGWRTPKGNRTGSVAATANMIFAMQGFNPLRFNYDKG